jgi:UDP-N-acetylglucosamine 2-epimerase (non-hydrolysing)/UDP-GlcNAc3NAcA epimerase
VKVVTVIGNRPQFVKAAAVSGPLRAEHEELLVHTGQHYDDELSTIFVQELAVPAPEVQLALGGGTNTEQTARMLAALGELLREQAPDAVLVYGDTNSTLAGALAAAQARIPVAHVEAGMRSFDRAMPEELNRVLTDHLADLLLVSSDVAAANLAREGAADDGPLRDAGVTAGEYVLATAHRAGTVDDPERLEQLVQLLLGVGLPVVLPLHPRTRARLLEAGLLDRIAAGTIVRPPLGYLAFTALLTQARAVLTDSGGVQKEAYLAGVPCVTLRDSTEWVETVDSGWNVLVDLDAAAARAALARPAPSERPELYGDGRAGARVAAAMARLLR